MDHPAKSIPARQRIAMLFDSFEAQSGSGESESVVIGVGEIEGHSVVAAIFEFGVLGGSMGEAAGGRLEEAMLLAAERGVPFLAVTSTGGARLQEGMAALAQMPRTVAASMELARRGVLRISVLAQPTTGGVYASFASLADVILAEEDATIGFAGPRVAEAVTGQPVGANSHTAGAAFEHGLVDAVVPPAKTREMILSILRAVYSAPRSRLRQAGPGPGSNLAGRAAHVPFTGPRAAALVALTGPGLPEAVAWDEFLFARHPDRPSPSEFIARIFSEVLPLHGDRAGGVDPAVWFGFARLDETSVVIAAFDRAKPTAAGFRQARRAIELAGRLGLPLVTCIDTPGAEPGFASEYGGLAGEIARTYAAILSVETPVIAVVTGEGGSGGALALACGDVVAMLQHAVFSVISPEGAATILLRDQSKASEVAEELKPTSSHLLKMGLVDQVIEEAGEGAHTDPEAAASALAAWLKWAVANTQADTNSRAARFRGPFNSA